MKGKPVEDTLYDVHCIQNCTKFEWEKSKTYTDMVMNFNPEVKDGTCMEIYNGIFLLDEHGRRTGVPVFEDFRELWSVTGTPNPFEYDWIGWSKKDMKYLKMAEETLEEQIVIWGTDSVTKESWVFGWIAEFASYLTKLRTLNDELEE